MTKNIRIRQESFYSIFETVIIYILLYILLVCIFLATFVILDIDISVLPVILIPMLGLFILAMIVASTLSVLNNGWFIEEDIIKVRKMNVFFKLKENHIDFKRISNISTNWSPRTKELFVLDLYVEYRSDGWSNLQIVLSLPRDYCEEVLHFLKEYKEAIQNGEDREAILKKFSYLENFRRKI